MKTKTLQTIKKHNLLHEHMHIVLGLSGGPDSVCLFHVLKEMAAEMDWKLYPVHINHQLRPGDAERDQQYVEELCRSHGLEAKVFTVDCNAMASDLGLTSEEAGRKARYEAFDSVAESIASSGTPKEDIAIALAHNAGDQCETILFRLIRGSGTEGLAGIAYKRFDQQGFAVVRPILDIKRAEIENYCKENNLNPCIDHTNDENLYARNRIRNMLIPYLEENFNSNIIDTVNRLGIISAEDKDFMRQEGLTAYGQAVMEESKDKITLRTENLLAYHKAIRFRVYTTSLNKLGLVQNISYGQIEAIESLLSSESPSASADLTEGYRAFRQYDKLVFSKESGRQGQRASWQESWRLREMTRQEFGEFVSQKRPAGSSSLDDQKRPAGSSSASAHCSSKEIFGAFSGPRAKDLTIRTRKEGDRIKLSNGTKKLKDFFVDEKLPKDLRDQALILAWGSKVLWVLPSEDFPSESLRQKGRFSADFKVTDQSPEPIIVLEKL